MSVAPAGFIGFHLLGLLAFLLFWGGVIVLAVWAIRSFASRPPGPPGPPPGPPPTPLEILQRRLAAGEITPEEYKKVRTALEA